LGVAHRSAGRHADLTHHSFTAQEGLIEKITRGGQRFHFFLPGNTRFDQVHAGGKQIESSFLFPLDFRFLFAYHRFVESPRNKDWQ